MVFLSHVPTVWKSSLEVTRIMEQQARYGQRKVV